MKILAIDTAFNACSVAIIDTAHGSCISDTQEIERGHAEKLVPMILDVMSSSGLVMADIDYIAVTTGPGAFTGMRVGISTAKAYGLALGKPVIGINSFEAMFETYCVGGKNYDAYAVILETKRDEYFCCILDQSGQVIGAPKCCDGNSVLSALSSAPKTMILIGDAVDRFKREIEHCGQAFIYDYSFILYPDIQRIAQKAQNIVEKSDSILEAMPIYLREADVTLPKKPLHYLKIN